MKHFNGSLVVCFRAVLRQLASLFKRGITPQTSVLELQRDVFDIVTTVSSFVDLEST